MGEDDAAFLRRFEAGEIPQSDWDQRAHVKVAFLYLRRDGWDAALERMRDHAKTINRVHGVPEEPLRGYNETTTVAFLKIVDAVRLAYEALYPAETADEFCDLHPELMNKHILRLFYSPQRRGHPDAKKKFVEPDLAPLPEYRSDG